MRGLEEFAFDTETNTLEVHGPNEDFSCVGVSISWGYDNNYYIPLNHRRYEDRYRNVRENSFTRIMKPVFENSSVRLIGANIKFDMHVMKRLGISINTHDLFDIIIASWLCDENSPNGLKENTQALFGIDQTHFKNVTDLVPKEVKKEFGLKANSNAPFDLVLIDEGAPYAIDDAFFTFCCGIVYQDLLEREKMDKIYWKLYAPFIRTLFLMEERGATVDTDSLRQMGVDMQKDLDKLTYQLYDLAGVEVNLKSSSQLAALLFGYKDTKPKKSDKGDSNLDTLIEYSFGFKVISETKKGAPQTNFLTLHKISQLEYKNKRKQEGVEFCKLLMQYKKLEKLKSAFVDGLEKQLYSDGKAHPSFNIIGADSGRISCSRPNLQQLPKAGEEDTYQIRSLFIGSEYLANKNGDYVCELTDATEEQLETYEVKRKKIVAGDFSNLEMRVLAHFSEDKNLLEMFANDSDTHGSTAVNMFELDCTPEEVKKKYPHLRQAAKVINFLLMYGGGAQTLYDNLRNDPYSPIDLGDKNYLDMYHVKKGVEVAQIYIDKYFDTYSGVSEFIKNQKRHAHKHGFVQTLLRRKRRLPGIRSNDFKTVAYCERLSVNAAVQGSAADITESAQNLVNADPWYEEHGVLMILQVHDELVFDCPEKYVDECISRTKAYMEHPFGPKVELNLAMRADFDSGDSYQEAK